MMLTFRLKNYWNRKGVLETVLSNNYDMSICLIIETDETIEYITDIVGVTPTEYLRKGEKKLKFAEPSDKNKWFFKERFKSCTEIGENFSKYFEKIPQIFRVINDLKKIGLVAIRLSIVSDYAQIGCVLSPEDLGLINDLGVPLEISIFSWGELKTNR